MTEAVFDFGAFLEGVEMPAEGVTIYQKPGLIAQLAKAREAVDAVKDLPEEITFGELSAKGRLQELQRRVAESKTVWYVSPLSRDTEKAIRKEYPEPKLKLKFDEKPPRLADRATQQQSETFQLGWAAYKQRHAYWEAEHEAEFEAFNEEIEKCMLARGAARIAASITYIETYSETGVPERKRVTLTPKNIEDAEVLLGQAQIGLLVEALDRVSKQPPADPDPFE